MSYGPTSDPSDKIRAVIAPPDKQYSIDGLRPDTEYMVSLTSSSGNMTSEPVNTTFTTGGLSIIQASWCFNLKLHILQMKNTFLFFK